MIFSNYSNLGSSALAILATLTVCDQLPLSKALLIPPLAMHDDTLSFLGKSNTKERGIAATVVKRPDLFVNFNNRFESCLPGAINAIQLLLELEWIMFHKGSLVLWREPAFDDSIGDIGRKIVKAATKISYILESPPAELYLNLRIKL